MLVKVLGSANPADLLTKHLSRPDMEKHLRTLSVTKAGGRAASAPELMPQKSDEEISNAALPK